MDGDARGGAALSMRAVTGKPIKLVGTGEKVDALEEFHPAARRQPHPRHGRHRLPRREGGGDDRPREGACASPRRCARASSTSTTCASSSARWSKIGGIGGVLGMLPGIGKMKSADRAGRPRRRGHQAPARHHRLDDRQGAPQPGPPQGLAQEAHRGGLRHQGRGRQQAPQDAPPDGRHDEGHGRPASAAASGRRSATCSGSAAGRCRSRRRSRSRRCRSRWAGSCRPSRRTRRRPAAAAARPRRQGPRPAGRLPGLGGPKLPGACRVSAASRSEGEEEVSFARHLGAGRAANEDRGRTTDLGSPRLRAPAEDDRE